MVWGVVVRAVVAVAAVVTVREMKVAGEKEVEEMVVERWAAASAAESAAAVVRKGVAEVGPEANTVALVDLEEAMVAEAWVPKLSRRGSQLRCNPRAAPGIARP